MRPMVRHLALSAVLVAFFTILIAATTELPFWVPLCVLSFNWIGAPLIGQRLESRNPSLDHENQETEGFGWRIFAAWITVFALVGWLVSWKWDLTYFTGFAYVLLMATTVLALNGIVIDVEDNQKGGWLNP
jgi:hypothetical protein